MFGVLGGLFGCCRGIDVVGGWAEGYGGEDAFDGFGCRDVDQDRLVFEEGRDEEKTGGLLVGQDARGAMYVLVEWMEFGDVYWRFKSNCAYSRPIFHVPQDTLPVLR